MKLRWNYWFWAYTNLSPTPSPPPPPPFPPRYSTQPVRWAVMVWKEGEKSFLFVFLSSAHHHQEGELKLWTLKELAFRHAILVITMKITPSERFFQHRLLPCTQRPLPRWKFARKGRQKGENERGSASKGLRRPEEAALFMRNSASGSLSTLCS